MIEQTKGAAATATPNNLILSSVEDTNNIVIEPVFEDDILDINIAKKHLKDLFKNNTNPKEFPVHAFPKEVQHIVKELDRVLGFNPDYTSASILAAVAACVGNTHKLYFKNNWIEPVILYIVLVGGKGKNKSGPLKWVMKWIEQKDQELFRQWKEQMTEYEAAMQLFKNADGGEAPKRPILKKVIISDYTLEALYKVHSYNRRGLCMYNDELAGWFKNFNKYNKGSEQEVWLAMFNGRPIIKDRTSSDSIYLDNPCVQVVGTLQPEVLDELAKDNRNENGFIDRLLFVRPDKLDLPSWNDEDLDTLIETKWQLIAKELLGLEMAIDDNGQETSRLLKLTPEARRLIIEWQNRNIDNDRELDSEIINGISAKIQIYALRFSILIQLLRWACDKANVSRGEVDEESVKSAILIAEYFKQSAISVAHYMVNKNPLDKLSEDKQKLYSRLNDQFEMKEALPIAIDYMTERSFKTWVTDPVYFKRIRQGLYRKTITY